MLHQIQSYTSAPDAVYAERVLQDPTSAQLPDHTTVTLCAVKVEDQNFHQKLPANLFLNPMF